MADEAVLLHQWLGSYLLADDPLRALVNQVGRDYTLQNTTLPYVVWSEQGGSDTPSPCGTALATVVMLVKVVYNERGDKTNAEAAVHRLHEILNGAKVVYQEYRITVLSLGPVGYTESPTKTGGSYYRHQGRLWRLTASNN